jgi:hypothetical protein
MTDHATTPDARLFTILRLRDEVLATINNAYPLEDDEGDALCEALAEIERAAMHCPITTPAGLAANAGMVHAAMKGCMAGVSGRDHLSCLLRGLFEKIEAIHVRQEPCAS